MTDNLNLLHLQKTEEIQPPKNMILSLDGLTYRFLQEYLENGQLDANTGLGYLINKGIFLPTTVTTPSNTAPVHIAIGTGSTAAHNNINNNSFHLIRSPFNENIRGFGAPVGGYDPFHPDGAHEATELTAEPMWVTLREAGKTVVSATFPGADGATVTLPGSEPPIVLQSNDIRTVDFTVPFGTGAGIRAQGFSLTEEDFDENPAQAIDGLSDLGIAFYGDVKVADLETIYGQEDLQGVITIAGGSDQDYDLQVAVIDTTDDNLINYDQLIVFDTNVGITINNNPPSTGSAFLDTEQNIAPFFFEGSNNVVGVSYLLTQLTPDLSTVHLIRTSANHIPRPVNNPDAIATIDNTNENVGFWRPQPDLNIARGTAPGLGNFSEIELEGAYATLNEAFSQYQTDIFLNAISQEPGADLALGYLEGPDGVKHNFLLIDPRQATDRNDPNSILEGQDLEKVARYQQLVLDAYQVASDRVQQVIDYVGVDANGVPNSNIIITSDHGFAPFHTSVNINNILTNAGFNRSEVRAVTGSSTVNIYINLEGREPDGTVSLSRYKELQQQIVETLEGLIDTNPNYVDGSAPIIDNIFRREVPDNATVEDVINATGEFIGQDTGDVFVQLSLGYTFNGFQTNVPRNGDAPPPQGERAILSVPTFYGDHGYDSNLPEMQASFIAAGPDFDPTTLSHVTSIRTIDIAPTILDILDVESADTVDGESIFAQNQPFTLQILHASDQEAGVPAFQDIPGFSAVMNALDGQYENSLKLTSGDVYIASPFFNASLDIYQNAPNGGIADILIQNELGWDAASVGNHEFTGGDTTLLNLLAPNANVSGVGIGDDGYLGALFPYLANNLDYSNARIPNGLTVVDNGGAPLPNTLTGSIVADVNGEEVGIIGIVTPYLKSIANTGLVEVTTLDADGNEITGTSPISVQVDSIIDNITPEVQALIDAGINKIILMTHLQESAIEQALAQEMADLGLGVDILLGGGSHQLMASEGGLPLREDETQQNTGQLLRPFPQTFTSGDNTVIFVNSAPNYRYVNQLVVTFDEEGMVTSIGDDSGAYATDIAGVDRLYDEDITTIEDVKAKADPEIVEIVAGVQTFVNSLDGNIFGQSDVFLNGIRGDVRTQETNLGNLVADSHDFYAEAYLTEYELLEGFDKIDISFQNGGTIRDFIGQSLVETNGSNELVKLPTAPNPEVGKEEGDISQLDISNAVRFDSDIVIGTVTAEGFLQLAEHMVSSVETGNGRFGQIGGFKFSFDPNVQAGSRIQNLSLTNETGESVEAIVVNGALVVDSDRTFSVVTSRFLANGGDSYPTVINNIVSLLDFEEPDSLGKADLNSGRQQDALAEYLSAFYNVDNGQDPYGEADTPQSEDKRIQNLNFQIPEPTELRIYDIQGTDLRSPLLNEDVNNVPGIVTVIASNGFYLQDPDGDDNPTTSDAIFVLTESRPDLQVGDSVEVSGRVTEFFSGNNQNNQPITQIGFRNNPAKTQVVSTENNLPLATLIGKDGRTPPTEIISPDGLLFYESLEGMLVTIQNAVAVSPTSNFSNNSEVWVLSNQGEDATGINSRDGITIAADDFNPERIQIDDTLIRTLILDSNRNPAFTLPQVNVGFSMGDLTGVVSYAFGNYEVLVTEPFAPSTGGLQREITEIEGTEDRVIIASYNVENLNPFSGARFEVLAEQIVNNLQAPDIIGLQEIQDNNGPINDGTVAADLTYQFLIDAIAVAGGPTYEFLNIDPVNNRDGGQAGSNIRVGYLYNPERVSFVEDSLRRITDPAATEVNDGAFERSRKPLVATFEFNGEEVTVINNHFTSRSGSTPLFGVPQPPDVRGVADREAQAQIVKNEVDAILANDSDANVVVLGDLNGFDFENFQAILGGDELTNLTQTLPVEERYSFNFQGNSQALDHVFVTNNLADDAEYDIVHVNVDFADQPADHEPLVTSLYLPDNVEPPLPELPETVFGSPNDDTFDSAFPEDSQFEGDAQNLFTGSGDDTVDVSVMGEGNRIDTGSGDDIVFVGTNNRVILGSGDDILFAGSGNGNNMITTGSGYDQIWLITDIDAIPEMMNKVSDFDPNFDVIGFANSGLTMADKGTDWNYQQVGSNVIISAFEQDIAQLNNTTITDANFVLA